MSPSPILDYLESLRSRLQDLSDGSVADYIPELGRADPDLFGLCIATRDGFVYEVGDSGQPFTIQSVSKPLTYGLALEANGEAAVLAKIGVEPSGDAFNAISLRPQTGAPLNPLINAGAIAACGLIPGRTVEQKTARILDAFSRYAGRALDIDLQVYAVRKRDRTPQPRDRLDAAQLLDPRGRSDADASRPISGSARSASPAATSR